MECGHRKEIYIRESALLQLPSPWLRHTNEIAKEGKQMHRIQRKKGEESIPTVALKTPRSLWRRASEPLTMNA
jgi:hypothetical protein